MRQTRLAQGSAVEPVLYGSHLSYVSSTILACLLRDAPARICALAHHLASKQASLGSAVRIVARLASAGNCASLRQAGKRWLYGAQRRIKPLGNG